MKATIKVYDGSNEILSKILDEGVYRAGRSEFADIVLPSDSVSRSHLEIRVTEAALYMTNMSTAGKVKLNGKPRETGELADGDELSLGPYRIVVFHGAREDQMQEMPPQLPASPDAPAEDNPDDAGNFGALESEPPPDQDAADSPAMPEFGGMGGGTGGGAAPAMELERDVAPLEGGTALNRAETQVEIKPVVAKLIFEEGPRAGEEMFLEAYEVALGRSKKADIFLDDEKLSRLHAKIARVGMGYRLIDLNSRNGTYVNGMRVLEHPLNSFDEIQIGNSRIKFLIHDLVISDMAQAQMPATVAGGNPVEQTKSLQMAPLDQGQLIQLQATGGPSRIDDPYAPWAQQNSSSNGLMKALLVLVGVLLVAFLLIPKAPPTKPDETKKENVAQKAPPSIPQEFMELSPAIQRHIEGLYNSALKSVETNNFKEGLGYLDQIHKVLPYYKQSLELQDKWTRQLKEQEIEDAREKAKRDEKEDLRLYIEEGKEYLKEADFERAGEAFNAAIVIDPTNKTAAKGLKAVEYKVRSIEDIPPDKDPEQEKRKMVADLFQKAVAAFTNKSYQLAIDTADKIRGIELKGETQYLAEAKQIIDRSRMLQKEEFEPFLIQAKEKYAEGDYNASRDLCDEMLKRDSAYDEAKDCATKAKKQLNRLAKEAYTHGYILESMNRIEEAKQYWNRAKNYVREGDDYYDKVLKKLEYYQ